ncbi:hypothetical protein OQA88_1398 [Cercophora sp. LCS_1]
MSHLPPLSLIIATDPPPNFNWFKEFDYGWFDTPGNIGNLSSIPFFETIPEQLNGILNHTSTHYGQQQQQQQQQQPLRLGFAPRDCETVSGERNCTEACLDPASLFTPTNLRVCTALAGAALLVQNGTYRVEDEGSDEVMMAWGVPELGRLDATQLFGRVGECIAQSCDVGRLGGCSEEVQGLGAVGIDAGSLAVFSERLGRYCDRVVLEINSDIAGPGVLLSYFLLTSLVLLFWLILKISRSWVRRLGIPFGWLSRQDKDEFRDNLAAVQNRLTSSRLGTAITSSLVEFQEVQIYFIISAQVATIIAYNPSMSNVLGANNNSFSAVILNSGLAAFLNISSMGCVFLAQCSLHKAGMRWWYIFTILTISFALALTMFALRNRLMPPVETLWEQFKEDGPLPLCGGNPSPMTYCGQSLETSYLDNALSGFLISALGGLTWLGLFFDQLVCSIRTRNPPLRYRLRRILDRYDHILQRKSRFWSGLAATYWFIIELLLFGVVTYHYSQLVLILENVSISDVSKWGFGQLIAVMVWAPTIVKCIYFNIFGVKGGFEERIPKEFQIIRDGEAEDPEPQKSDKGLQQQLTKET